MRITKVNTPIKLALVIANLFTFVACGSSSNLNKIFGSSDPTSRRLLIEAKAAYNDGDYETAESLINDILVHNADDEDAAVLLGYVYLSQAGMDPFSLAQKLIDNASTSTGLAGSTSNASTLLTSLGSLVNMTADTYALLGTKKTDDTYSGNADYPVLLPKSVTSDLRNSVPTLAIMNKAVKNLCRFVSSDAKNTTGDERHAPANCGTTPITPRLTAKSHFIWAFAHLTEALVFQSTLQYAKDKNGNNNADGIANIQKRADLVKNGSLSTANLVSAMADLSSAVSSIFDTSSASSQISTTLVAFDITSRAFGAIAGMPASVSSGVTKSMESLKSSAGGASSSSSAQAGQLRVQMTSGLATSVSSKISALPAGADKTAACNSYKELVKGNASATLPTGC